MTETPTPDDIARWAALAEQATAGPWGKLPSDHARGEWFVQFAPGGRDTTVMQANDAEFIAAAREAVPRLLALVAAQAEQNAELRGTVEHLTRATDEQIHRKDRAVAERDAALAELSALRATDEYQRWARAVVERDAAREQVAAMRARVEAEIESWHHTVVEDCWYTCPAATEEREGETCCDDDRRGAACDCGLDFRKAKIRAALDGGAAT